MNLPTKTGIRAARTASQQPDNRRSFRELTRRYFAHETRYHSVIETVIFAIIGAISAWPIFAAVDALNKFLQNVT
jgi:hypothetical protein